MFTIAVIILADLIGFSLLVPIYPLLQDYYRITELQVGYFVQIWALFLCLGGLFWGVLSDKFSRRTGLLFPILGSFATYLIAFFVDQYSVLLICRAFNGFFNGNFVVAMAAVSDISSEEEDRLKNMSATGGVLALSWVIGPMLGGLISSLANTPYLKIHLPFLVSTAFSLLALFLLLFFFPHQKDDLKKAHQEEASGLLKEFFHNLMNRKALFYAALNIFIMMFLTGGQIYFSLWIQKTFSVSIREIGIIWGLFSLAAFLGQVTIRKYLSKANSFTLIVLGFIGIGIGYISWCLLNNIFAIYFFGFSIYYFGAFGISGINTKVSLSARRPNQMGLVFGINQGFSGLGRILAPTFFGFLVISFGYRPTWLLSGAISFLVGLLCIVVFKKNWLEKKQKEI